MGLTSNYTISLCVNLYVNLQKLKMSSDASPTKAKKAEKKVAKKPADHPKYSEIIPASDREVHQRQLQGWRERWYARQTCLETRSCCWSAETSERFGSFGIFQTRREA